MECLPLAAELGDCELTEHTPELVSEFRFTPNQTEAMEFEIFQKWKEFRYGTHTDLEILLLSLSLSRTFQKYL